MSKLTTMADAIARLVPDGASVALGCPLEPLIPFAAGHELIRQRRRELTLIGPISDILFDQLIGAGCVSCVRAAWIGNVSAGLGHAYRRAAEHGIPRPLAIHEYSNFTIALALRAAALGAPFIPTSTLLGSDIVRSNPDLRVVPSPLDGRPLVLVPALAPDVAILHVQRADETGHAHVWGNLGLSQEAALAAQRVILVAEEIVAPELIRSDPNRVIVPGFKVGAVVHAPGGAHPSPVQGYYNRDHEFFHAYHLATRTHAGLERWLDEWVHDLPDRAAYLTRLGDARWRTLAPSRSLPAARVDYGF